MKLARLIAGLGAALALSACAGSDLASRNLSSDTTTLSFADTQMQTSGVKVMGPRYNVAEINIDIPRNLRVSEANVFYPLADIVWRGDPRGDRYTQIQSIFADALGLGTGGMKSGPKVIVDVKLVRFHAVTEKTRYTFGGVHDVRFTLTVRDAATGAVLDGPRLVVADVHASGGAQAIAEDQAGRTQRVVIVEHLSQVIRRELSGPVAPAAAPSVVSQGDFAPAKPANASGISESTFVPVKSNRIPLTPARMMAKAPIPF